MFDAGFVKVQRFSALANGVLIGFGVFFLLAGGLIGAVGVVAGVGLEIWQRMRISRMVE